MQSLLPILFGSTLHSPRNMRHYQKDRREGRKEVVYVVQSPLRVIFNLQLFCFFVFIIEQQRLTHPPLGGHG